MASQHVHLAALFVLIPLLGATIVYVLHATGVICLDSFFNLEVEDSANLKLPLFLPTLWRSNSAKPRSPKSASSSPRGLARPKSPKSEMLPSICRPASPPTRRSQQMLKSTSKSLNDAFPTSDVQNNSRSAQNKFDVPVRSQKIARVCTETSSCSDIKRKDDSLVVAASLVEDSAACASDMKSGAKRPDAQTKPCAEVRGNVLDKKSKTSSSGARSKVASVGIGSQGARHDNVSQAPSESPAEMKLKLEYPAWEKCPASLKEPEISAMAAQLCRDPIHLSGSSRSSSACSTPIGTPVSGTPSVSPRPKADILNRMHLPNRSIFASDPLNIVSLASTREHTTSLAQTSWATVPGLDFVPPPVPPAVRSAFESSTETAPIGATSPRQVFAPLHQLTPSTGLIPKNMVDLLQPHSSSPALTYPTASLGRTQNHVPSVPQSNPWSRQEKPSAHAPYAHRPASPPSACIWEPLTNLAALRLPSLPKLNLEARCQVLDSQAWIRPLYSSSQISTPGIWTDSPSAPNRLSHQGSCRSLWGSDGMANERCFSDGAHFPSSHRSFFSAVY